MEHKAHRDNLGNVPGGLERPAGRLFGHSRIRRDSWFVTTRLRRSLGRGGVGNGRVQAFLDKLVRCPERLLERAALGLDIHLGGIVVVVKYERQPLQPASQGLGGRLGAEVQLSFGYSEKEGKTREMNTILMVTKGVPKSAQARLCLFFVQVQSNGKVERRKYE